MSWDEIVGTYLPIATFVTPIMMAGGFAWLKTQFPTKAELEQTRADLEAARKASRTEIGDVNDARKDDIAELAKLANKMDARQVGVEHQIKGLVKDFDRSPSKIELSKDIGKLAERVGHLESGIDAFTNQLSTHNQYLHTLLEKHIQ